MSDFTEDTLRYLEKLSCIQCDPEEEEKIARSLKKILDYVEQLDEIDTKDIPTFWSDNLSFTRQTLREDLPKNLLDHDTYLDNVSEKTAGMIRVPTILGPKGEEQ